MHSSSRHLRPLLNREILSVEELRLRIRSIVPTEPGANPSTSLGSYSCAGPKLRVPAEQWKLVETLERFTQRCEKLRGAVKEGDIPGGTAARELFDQYSELERLIRRHLPPDPELVSEAEAERAFAAGAMLLLHYEETVFSDLPLVDTIGSRTLTGFRVDFENSASGRRRVRRALERAFQLGPEGLAELQLALRPELDALGLRHTIVLGLDQLHPLRTGDSVPRDSSLRDSSLREAVYSLFDRLYRSQVFRPGEVDLIRTGTSFFFSVPFPGTPEFDDALAARSPMEQDALRAYMGQFGDVRQIDYANFPVFGFFRGEGADPALLAGLAEATGLPRQQVAAVLSTMVSILPRHEVDKYIVHDAWGHQWQAALLEFEEAYQEVATYQRLPDLDHEVTDRGGKGVRFRDALDQIVDSVSRGEEPRMRMWDRFLEAELGRRLVVSKNGLVAELLADVVEYKYLSLHPDHRKWLVSSSFFKDMPAKIDLTLSDVSYFVELALSGFERLIEKPEAREELAARYREGRTTADAEHVRVAVDRLTRRTAEWLEWLFAPSPHYEKADDGIYMNRCGRILFTLLGLGAALNAKISALKDEKAPAGLAVRGFHDLLVLSIAALYDRDRERNFWRLDEYVNHHFERCYRRFMKALEEESRPI